MAFGLNYGRDMPCINAKAGIKSLFVAKWKPYVSYQTNNGLISGVDADFVELESNEITADVNTNHTDEGEVVSVNITLNLIDVDLETSNLLHKLNDMFLIVGTIDEYDNIRVYGIKNGMALSFSETSGGSKTSFKGYNVNIKGLQTNQPSYGDEGVFDTNVENVLMINQRILNNNNLTLVIDGT